MMMFITIFAGDVMMMLETKDVGDVLVMSGDDDDDVYYYNC